MCGISAPSETPHRITLTEKWSSESCTLVPNGGGGRWALPKYLCCLKPSSLLLHSALVIAVLFMVCTSKIDPPHGFNLGH